MKRKLSKKTKIILGVAATLAVLTSGIIITKKVFDSKSEGNEIYVVSKQTYENCIEIAGTVSAASEQTLQALSDGTVLGVYVQKGSRVKKGDIILQLDDTEQKYNLAELDNQILTAKYNSSKNEQALLQTKRTFLLQKIENRKVIATFDGIIADLDVAVGDYMEAKDSVGTLVNVDYLKAEVEVAETDVSKLKAGQTVDFTFPSYSGKTVKGQVLSWPAIGTVTSRGATVVNVTVRIDDYPEGILPNYSFTGKIQITEPEDFLVVENYAVGHEDGQAFVQLASSGEKINVKVAPYAPGYVQILDGVEEGARLKAQSKAKVSGSRRGMSGGPRGMGGMGGRPPF